MPRRSALTAFLAVAATPPASAPAPSPAPVAVTPARFDAAYWDDALGTYVLALDGDKRPCAV